MIQAYGAIANGGNLMKPIDNSGNQNPEVIRKVLSKPTSSDLREALREVVVTGTATTIRNSRVSIAGKTSTTDVGDRLRVTGFIGYAPAEKPKAHGLCCSV